MYEAKVVAGTFLPVLAPKTNTDKCSHSYAYSVYMYVYIVTHMCTYITGYFIIYTMYNASKYMRSYSIL